MTLPPALVLEPAHCSGSVWRTGKKSPSWGQGHVRVKGRSICSRLAKQIAAPKQTLPVQSAAAAWPPESPKARLRPSNPSSLLPGLSLAGGGGAGAPAAKRWTTEPPPPPNPWKPKPAAAGSAKSKTYPLGARRPLRVLVLNPECFPSPLRARDATFVRSLRDHTENRGDWSGDRKEQGREASGEAKRPT